MQLKISLTVLAVTCLLGWFILVFFTLFGMRVGTVETSFIKFPFYVFLFTFPIASVAAVYFLWQTDSSMAVVGKPFFWLIGFCLVASVVGAVKSYRAVHLELTADQDWSDFSLDGYIDGRLPKSFELEKKSFHPHVLENFYGLEPSVLIGDHFDYRWVRGAYTNAGGIAIAPVVLILAVHDDTQSIGQNLEACSPVDGYECVAHRKHPSDLATLSLYADVPLDRKSAQNLIEDIAKQIHIRRPWKQRLEEIKSEFYSRHPDKKPIDL